jgi:hypothetical protein
MRIDARVVRMRTKCAARLCITLECARLALGDHACTTR